MANIVNGTTGGKHVVNGPLTTELTAQAAPDLLLNDVDQQIVKVRPMATPIDQITRLATHKRVSSMVVDYWSVDTKPTSALVSVDYDESEHEPSPSAETQTAVLKTDNDEIFDPSDTILAQGVMGYDADGVTQSSHDLVLYVLSRDNNGIVVAAVNGKKVGNYAGIVPSIDRGTRLVRMGRAASELDAQSPQFEALPKRMDNLCQIFKMQVEQSTLQRLAKKEVGWNMTDQEEAAIYDMRLGMEKSFLFGTKGRIWDTNKKEHIYLTGGLWHQAGQDFNYSTGSFGPDEVVALMKKAFTGNAGSRRKILIGGSDLISAICKLETTRVVLANESVSKWGIDFTELRSKFGTLYVVLSEIFDEVGMSGDGIVIDPEYLVKYVHIPFSAESIDLKSSGTRNTDALVMTEASCVVLRYPQAHVRINAQ